MKKTTLKTLSFLVCGIIVLAAMGCAPPLRQGKGGTDSLKYNFHYTSEKGRNIGSVANYTKMTSHEILPYGSAVSVERWKKGFALIDKKSGRQINVVVKSKFLAGMSIPEYLDKILSTKPVSYSGLSNRDKTGIRNGVPSVGMSKKGIMIALGYPCPHKASPSSDIFYYWRNRFSFYWVTFEDDLVVSINNYDRKGSVMR